VAEFLIFAKNHWMDALTPQEVADRAAESYKFQRKYASRYQRGDIVEVRENGYWIGGKGFNRDAFVVVQVSDMTVEAAKDYTKAWYRDISFERITNDTENHIYEYRVTLNRTRTDIDDELFSAAKDRFRTKPKDVSLVSRSSTEIVIRLEPLLFDDVIDGSITPIERRDKFQQIGKREIAALDTILRRRMRSVRAGNLPQAAKDLLQSRGWVSYTKAQVASYLRDKRSDSS